MSIRHLKKFVLDLVQIDTPLLQVLGKIVQQISGLVLDQRIRHLERIVLDQLCDRVVANASIGVGLCIRFKIGPQSFTKVGERLVAFVEALCPFVVQLRRLPSGRPI